MGTDTPNPSRRSLLAALPAVGITASTPLPVAASPDAELLALCAAHEANVDAHNRDGGFLEPEDCPLWAAYYRTYQAISAARPRTLEGVVAKARAAKIEAINGEGSENTVAGRWAWDLVNDLDRLYGRHA